MNPFQEKDRDLRPPKGSWAPGYYLCLCRQCHQHFTGEKRASACADCAYQTFKPLHPVESPPEEDPWKQTGLTGTELDLCKLIASRQEVGKKKYGVQLRDNPLSLRDWLTHSIQEKADDLLYMLRAVEKIDQEASNSGQYGDH